MRCGRSILAVAVFGAAVVAASAGLQSLDDRPVGSASLTDTDVGPPVVAEPRMAAPGEAVVAERAAKYGCRVVRVQFRCETLRDNVTRVWRHIDLEVRVADEHGRTLAVTSEPWSVETLSLPASVERIVFLAKGYKRKSVAVRELVGGAPATVVLEPDAVAHVRAGHLPAKSGNEFEITARFATGVDAQGRPLLDGLAQCGPSAVARRGELSADIKVPSGVPVRFIVSRTRAPSDERSGFVPPESPMLTLAPGEERIVEIDLMSRGTLAGRVAGVPTMALKGQLLSLWTGRERATEIVLDDNGRFRIIGLPDQQVRLRLRTDAGQWPELVDTHDRRRQWRGQGEGFLVVQPEAPVFAVVPVQGGRVFDRFRVQVNSPPDPRSSFERIPLFTKPVLDRQPLFFFVPGVGHFRRSLWGMRADPDGVYRVEVPEPGGGVVVRVENAPEDGVQLFVQPEGSGESPVRFTGERSNDEWRFEGLAAGHYELVVGYGGQSARSERALPETVTVRSGRQTRITVQMPELLDLRGRVQNWRDIPAALKPDRLEVVFAGRRHNAVLGGDGRFRVTVLGPMEGISEIVFAGRHQLAGVKASDVAWLPAKNRFSVLYPRSVRERRLVAEPVAGGRMWIQAHVAGSRGRHLKPETGNRFVVAQTAERIDGVLLEHAGNLRILRGWFRLDAGGPTEVRLAPKGRWVQVLMSKPTGRATLTLKPPAWWRHGRYAWATLQLRGDEPRRLWLPGGARAVVIDNDREIPVAAIGDRLVID